MSYVFGPIRGIISEDEALDNIDRTVAANNMPQVIAIQLQDVGIGDCWLFANTQKGMDFS